MKKATGNGDFFHIEPARGFEPRTHALQKRCSTN